MPCVYICVVTGQPLANLIPFLHFKPDVVVLAASPKMAEKALHFERMLLRLHKTICLITEKELPEHTLENIEYWTQECIDRIKTRFPDHSILFNATGGNKLMTLAMVHACEVEGDIDVFYMDTDHERIEWILPRKRDAEKVPPILTLETCLRAQGKRLERCSSKKESWQQNAMKRKSLSRWLAKEASSLANVFGIINKTLMDGRNRNVSWSLNTIWELPARIPKTRQALEEMEKHGLIQICGNLSFIMLQPDAGTYLTGGWIEEYVWHVLQDENLDEVLGGLEISDEVSRKEKVPNELDVAAIHRNRLLLIECKTAHLNRVKEFNAVLYKLDSTGKETGGIFGQKWLIMARMPDSTPEVREQNRMRAKALGIELIGPRELPKLAEIVRFWKKHLFLKT
ncbi:uncharacterized protein DUF1887 [Desulfobotulus alkaliphilus]|uniref:Uncharacterized protein DUF1887 n=1 Tax=Desulfobotulus alkaliphilus TaxID=622671 RepID=A0A562RH08_9BACT|nr:DUF1887 family CARF protein [Desulfobotulus alkaliphilus]TWI68173.1 uncharacterized protein DUF1887 [Desulfobotulus alkaliphilus]